MSVSDRREEQGNCSNAHIRIVCYTIVFSLDIIIYVYDDFQFSIYKRLFINMIIKFFVEFSQLGQLLDLKFLWTNSSGHQTHYSEASVYKTKNIFARERGLFCCCICHFSGNSSVALQKVPLMFPTLNLTPLMLSNPNFNIYDVV